MRTPLVRLCTSFLILLSAACYIAAQAPGSNVIRSSAAAKLPQGEWTWEGGSSQLGSATSPCGYGPNSVGVEGVYGTLGVPSTSNVPGSRRDTASWTDMGGNFWIFGGTGFTGTGACAVLNDLWRFNPATHQWTWIGGSSNPLNYQVGVYGAMGRFAAANVPGSRDEAVTWTDRMGDLWLFGGFGYDSAGTQGQLNDLWMFSTLLRQWVWMGGSKTANRAGVYGKRGVASASNVPGGRYGAVGWTDRNGNFWLFGGYGYDSTTADFGPLNDLWEFNLLTRRWTWMGGSDLYDAFGDYGRLGVASPGNQPGARYGATAWTGRDGRFWLFGGWGNASAGASGDDLQDLWVLNPATREWTWVTGSSTQGTELLPTAWGMPGVYGALGVPAAGNSPGGRYYAAGWTDAKGNLWLFGGAGFDTVPVLEAGMNDLWEFDMSLKRWTWMGGSSTSADGASGVYGAKRTPAAANFPGGRQTPATWTDNSGNLWLFGGIGRDSVDDDGELNDMWEYRLPDPPERN